VDEELILDDNAPVNVHHLRVRSHQTDLNAAMYHAAYLDVFDDARIETFRRLGYTYERMLGAGWGVVIRSIRCDYSAPAFMDELLQVTVSIPRMTKATLTIRYECTRNGAVIAVGENVYAFLDSSRKPIPVPRDLREVIDAHAALLHSGGH
jgi:acyl-CoA thioester hydrolase